MTPSTSRTETPPLPLMVVDDDPSQRRLLEGFLTSQGFSVHTATGGEEALEWLAAEPVGMVVSDVRMPGMTGLEMLRRIRKSRPHLPVLLVTAYADVRDAVEAMRDGAVNYLQKPIDLDELLSSVRYGLGLIGGKVPADSMEGKTGSASVAAAPASGGATPLALPPPSALRGLVCQSPAMRDVVREVMAVAPTDSRVLIAGESGVGKDAIAELIHRLSPRAASPLVKLACAGVVPDQIETLLLGIEPGAFDDVTVPAEGLVEQAEGGTLVLDEVGELPPALQATLLRLIEDATYRRLGGTQDRRVDIRILATTRADLEAETAAGRFREDLFYRLNVFGIHIPTLAERRDDVLPLANRFIEQFSGGRPRFSASALLCIESYAWPGNARELQNAMERAALMARGDVILPEHLPRRVREAGESPAGPATPESTTTMEEIERSVILQTLRENKYNRSETARRLGISRRALIYKLNRFREQGFSIESTE